MKTLPAAFAGLFVLLPFGMAAQTPAPTTASEMRVLKTIPLPGDGGWDYLTADSASHRLFISRGTHVMVFDTEAEKIVGDIPDTPGVHGIALAPKLGHGYTSNGRDNSVSIFDLKTLKETSRVKVGKNPDCILYDSASKRVFTFNGESKDTTAIDAETGKVAGTIALGGKPEFAASDHAGTVFVNIEDTSEIVALDSKMLTIKHRWPIAPVEEPSGLAIDRKHHRLFAVGGNEKMAVVDTETGKVVATPTIGKGPDAAGWDSKEGVAYSSNGEGTITVIKEESPDTFTVAGTITTQPGARTMAVDTATHRIYLVTAKVAAPPAEAPAPVAGQPAQRWRGYEPGTFTLVVVGK